MTKKAIFVALILFQVLYCIKKPTGVNVNQDTSNDNERNIVASFNLNRIATYARSICDDLILKDISSDNVDPYGKTQTWTHRYYSFSRDVYYFLNCSYNNIEIDSLKYEYLLFGGSTITQEWIDSDIAAQIAEFNGGKNFRYKTENCIIKAELYQACVPNAPIVWYFEYQDNNDKNNKLSIGVNANTGKVINF